jgi:hydroxypyruvate isomerase
MPKFAANLSMMFTEVPFLDRFAAASNSGFSAAEFLFPYEYSPEVVARQSNTAEIEIILFNLPAGDWSAGERGFTCIPGREEEFRTCVNKALDYATHLDTKQLHAMAGVPPRDADPRACRRTLVENLKYAADRLAGQDIVLLLEAINTRDMPGFFVSTQEDCYSICEEVNAPNLKMQMDLYHMQVMEGDLTTKLKRYARKCGHIQIAGCPDRNEPDTGEICYEYLFQTLDALGYEGWVGCEYRPTGKTGDGVGWLKSWAATKAL